MSNNSRVIVLGGSGFIGGEIISQLRSSGIPHLSITRNNIDWLQKDASKKLAAIIKHDDIIIAVAANAPVKTVSMLSENLRIVNEMCLGLEMSAPSYILNISSDAVYEDSEGQLCENSTRAPTSLHGAMHLSRELAFESLGLPLGILCPTLVYGKNDPHNGYGPNLFSRLTKKGDDIKLFGEGEEQRDHIHVSDVAKIAINMTTTKKLGRINAATGEVTSFSDIANLCITNGKKQTTKIFVPRNGPMPHNGYRAFNISKLKKDVPNYYPIMIAEGIKELFSG